MGFKNHIDEIFVVECVIHWLLFERVLIKKYQVLKSRFLILAAMFIIMKAELLEIAAVYFCMIALSRLFIFGYVLCQGWNLFWLKSWS